MRRASQSPDTPSPPHLLNVIAAEFNPAQQALDLFGEFLSHTSYSRRFALELIGVAKGHTGAAWEVRRLATLMLEHLIFRLPEHDLDEIAFLLVPLNLKPAAGSDPRVYEWLLKEGYTTTDLREFVAQFRRRLRRLDRLHRRVKGVKAAAGVVRDFISTSRRDCKLTLARYLFTPAEVVERILKQVRVTSGQRDESLPELPCVAEEIARRMSLLPDYEAAILEGLRETADICWAAESTGSEINSLVEYPLTTVVLVVKPPGSDTEFEIKRAGRKGARKLNVVYRRQGKPVPPSHRLDGASMQTCLQWEAQSSSLLSSIYRLVHKAEPPIALPVSISSIQSVPVGDVARGLADYFTDADAFGDGFVEMRAAMEDSVAAFRREGRIAPPQADGEPEVTELFLNRVSPAQTILCGTTSFRLDKLAAYLSADGPDRYFKEGLATEYSDAEARQLADEILEEVLGVYTPPDVEYRSYRRYVERSFAVKENRAWADGNFLSVMQQIGTFWGTLLAVRGYTCGESFVGRNVGLKSRWDGGRWNVAIIFMDHDDLHVTGRGSLLFHPHEALPGMRDDERYIWGDSNGVPADRSEVDFLEEIYRVGRETAGEGRAAVRQAVTAAYRKTHDEFATNPQLRQLFHEPFVERLSDWDVVVKSYLNGGRTPPGLEAWKEETRRLLRLKGYGPVLIEEHLDAVVGHAEFLATCSFLY